jgi:hypothetical protein
MTFTPLVLGVVSTNNSSASTLTSGSTFTGTGEEVKDYANITVNVFADVASASGGLEIQFSSDNTNWDMAQKYTVSANTAIDLIVSPLAQYFRLVYTNGGTGQSTFRLQSIFTTSSKNTVTITAETLGGAVQPVTSNIPGALNVSIVDPSTGFGEVSVAEKSTRVAVDFVYNIQTLLCTTTVANGGTATYDNTRCRLRTNTTANGSAFVETIRPLKYELGQGSIVRNTGVFATGTTNTEQLLGFGDAVDGFFFGYNGTSFGVLQRNNSVDTWTPQTSWNLDVLDGSGNSGKTLNPQLGNVYQIVMQWLGFGSISFFIQPTDASAFILVHQIKYAGSSAVPSTSNPSLPLTARITNSGGNTTDLSMYVVCLAGQTDGKIPLSISPIFSYSALVKNNYHCFTIRVLSTFDSTSNKTNYGEVVLATLSIANDDNQLRTVSVIANTSASLTYSDILTDVSIVEVAEDDVDITGGIKIGSFDVGRGSSLTQNLSLYNFAIFKGTSVSFVAEGASTVSTTLSWYERL